jgi:serine phosphatase RsbU (regulator of sigma subunit)
MSIRVRLQSPHTRPADYDLDGPEIVIGRAAGAAIVIPDTRVSRQHARIVRRNGEWWVEDLGTRNGTLLNGEPMAGAAKLEAGDRLDIGDSVVRFMGDAADAEATAATDSHRAATDAMPVTMAGGRDAVRMRALNEIHRALAESLSLAELLDVILARCFDVLEPEEGVIMLRGADGTLTAAASRRLKPGGTPVTIPRRLVDEVAGKARPALVVDAAYDERFVGSESIVSSGMRSIVAAPLVDAEGGLGLITLCSRLAVRQFTQSDLDMLVSIASAVALRVRNVALADALAERRVIEHEMALAHDVQMSMLPRDMPPRADVAVAARLKPARSVGGDLYDFVLDGDCLWFIVADVAGKSIAAALYMAIVRTLFRAMARGEAGVLEVAGGMNRELARDNERMMFVTAAVGCLDLRSGALALVDAGHNPAVLVGAAGGLYQPAVPKGVAFGVLPDAPYTEARLMLDPGATLVLYTDGLTEARGPTGEMFGEERLRLAIDETARETPEALVAAVVRAVERFAAGTPPDDDLTLLALRYSGKGFGNL